MTHGLGESRFSASSPPTTVLPRSNLREIELLEVWKHASSGLAQPASLPDCASNFLLAGRNRDHRKLGAQFGGDESRRLICQGKIPSPKVAGLDTFPSPHESSITTFCFWLSLHLSGGSSYRGTDGEILRYWLQNDSMQARSRG
jgi:hypothetical protein